jgi:hypothetical protein
MDVPIRGRERTSVECWDASRRRALHTAGRRHFETDMEFLNFLLIFAAGWLVVRRPDRERLAFALLVTSGVLMAALFFLGTRTSVLPPFNY